MKQLESDSPSAQWPRVQTGWHHFYRGISPGGLRNRTIPRAERAVAAQLVGDQRTPTTAKFQQPSRPSRPSRLPKADPPPNVVRPAPVDNWVSLNHWAAEHKIGTPHLLSDLPVATYAIGSTNGVMVLEIGSREATWNGIEINLGFEPQLIDGQIFLHELDLQRNLEPLLCDPPLTFGTNRVIVIDPGHGGSNTGTHSVLDGRFEKEFTLDWA